MIAAWLVALGPWIVPILITLLVPLYWLLPWLIVKGGWWRVLAWLILAGVVVQVAPLVFS
jgi:hypothetical protein